uniref:Uncharacterized protein n=1 Tax=Arundo donax TaxID=35708 RepID=A0A0A8XY42_ARUDO
MIPWQLRASTTTPGSARSAARGTAGAPCTTLCLPQSNKRRNRRMMLLCRIKLRLMTMPPTIGLQLVITVCLAATMTSPASTRRAARTTGSASLAAP